jgi:hypothetical protein
MGEPQFWDVRLNNSVETAPRFERSSNEATSNLPRLSIDALFTTDKLEVLPGAHIPSHD